LKFTNFAIYFSLQCYIHKNDIIWVLLCVSKIVALITVRGNMAYVIYTQLKPYFNVHTLNFLRVGEELSQPIANQLNMQKLKLWYSGHSLIGSRIIESVG